MRVARTFLIVCALGTLVLSCGKSPLGPARAIFPIPGTRALVLDLTVSETQGSPGQPVTIETILRNTGTASVFRLQGGGLCQGMKIDVLDDAGGLVPIVDPCLPVPIPLCAPPGPFPPGESVRTWLSFSGDTYRLASNGTGCERVDAPTGTYTASVGFWVQWNANDPPELLEQRVTFHWTGS